MTWSSAPPQVRAPPVNRRERPLNPALIGLQSPPGRVFEAANLYSQRPGSAAGYSPPGALGVGNPLQQLQAGGTVSGADAPKPLSWPTQLPLPEQPASRARPAQPEADASPTRPESRPASASGSAVFSIFPRTPLQVKVRGCQQRAGLVSALSTA